MGPRHAIEFVLLGALWGGSFLFMRIASPQFGPLALVLVRCTVAAVFLVALLALRRGAGAVRAGLLRDRGRTLLAGVINSAAPFTLFGFAVLSLDAGFTSVMNATAPIFGAIVAWLWLGERLSASRIAGLALGIAGVVALSWHKASFDAGGGGWAVLACVLATTLYGVGASYVKRHLRGTDPWLVATGSQIGATIALLPFGLANWPAAPPDAGAWSAAVVLGLACTGLAYVIYFRLMAQVSAAAAMSVTYLVPVFGILWGVMFLGETVNATMLAGGVVIVLGTALATGMLQQTRTWRRLARRA
ncbi:MAG: DMT family transporter [Lautropia sp.]